MPSSPLNPTAAILAIGDELLAGRTQDKNIYWLTQHLTAIGISVKQARIIGDDKQAIIQHVRSLSAAHDYVFTSGGIGPTHDDITTDSIAAAFGLRVIRHSEAEARLSRHYHDTDTPFTAARQKMADIPETALLIDNPISAAPGYQINNIYVMAGIPAILQAMFASIAPTLKGGMPPTRITLQCAIGEGTIAEIMTETAQTFSSVSIGSYPWFNWGFNRGGNRGLKPSRFGTAVVITALDAAQAQKAATHLEQKIQTAGFKVTRED